MADFFYTIIIYPLIQLIQFSFTFVYRFCKNPGIAVIGVSLAVTIFCLPLYIVAEHWQAVQREIEKVLSPRTARIKAAFKGDEQYMMLNTYYRQNNYHPLMALRSSFGLLIQVPFFMAAYSYLSNLEALRGTSFLFIKDMGAQDALFTIGSFPVNILPIAMTVINIIAGAIYTKGFPVKEKVQIYGMAVIFLAILYTSPSGLVLYWTMNNVFSLVKNIFYKIKNPLKTLYVILCVFIAGIDVFLIFFFNKSPRILPMRIAAVIFFTALIFIPYYIKAYFWLTKHCFKSIMEDKKLRFGIFISTAISLCLYTGAILPSLLVTSSVQEFADLAGHACPDFFVWNTLVQSMGLFVFWPLCIYFLFHEKVQTLITVLFSSLLLCAIANTFIFPGSYGTMSQWLVFTSTVTFGSAPQIILNLTVTALITAGIFLLLKFQPRLTRQAFTAVLTGFVLFSGVELFRIKTSYADYRKLLQTSALQEADVKKEITLSKTGNNVVIFMLDRALNAYVQPVFEECPWLFEDFEGFTLYSNTVSFNGHTLFASPAIYGGYEYTPEERFSRKGETLKEQHNQALLMLPRIFTEQADFTAMVSDLSWANWSWIPDMHITDSYPKIKGKNLVSKYNSAWERVHPEYASRPDELDQVLRRDFLWVSLFRSAPQILRPFIYYDETWWNLDAPSKCASYAPDYPELDLLPDLTEISGQHNSFNCIVNELTHGNDLFLPPDYRLPAPDKKSASGTSPYAEDEYYSVNAACLNAIGRYLKFLKEAGVYDNTRIILVSDHGGGEGESKITWEGFDQPTLNATEKNSNQQFKDYYHPLLMVKDFNSRAGFTVSNEFMTNADVPVLALKDIIEKPYNPFSGKPVTDSMKTAGAKIMTPFVWNVDQITDAYSYPVKASEWFTVKDDIFKDQNWIQGK